VEIESVKESAAPISEAANSGEGGCKLLPVASSNVISPTLMASSCWTVSVASKIYIVRDRMRTGY